MQEGSAQQSAAPAARHQHIPPELREAGSAPPPLPPAFAQALAWSRELASAGEDPARRIECHDRMMASLREALCPPRVKPTLTDYRLR